jgi:hypothetical protein
MAYNAKKTATKKERRAKELQEFRSIFKTLKKELDLKEMETITGIRSSNLSAYGSGAKNPGEANIKLFYTKLKDHIDNLPGLSKPSKTRAQASRSAEEPLTFKTIKRSKNATHDLIQLLSANYDRMWVDIEKRGKTFDKIADSNFKMADSNNKMADTTSQLATTNAKLVAINVQLYEKLFLNSGDTSAPDASNPQS